MLTGYIYSNRSVSLLTGYIYSNRSVSLLTGYIYSNRSVSLLTGYIYSNRSVSLLTGYIYANGVSEAVLGMLVSSASAAGVLGIGCFALLRRQVGLERTGLTSFNAQLLCLVLCVASIWAVGSPFGGAGNVTAALPLNCTYNATSAMSYVEMNVTSAMSYSVTNATSAMSYDETNATLAMSYVETNVTSVVYLCTSDANQPAETSVANLSIILFLIGIITSRVGKQRDLCCEWVFALKISYWCKLEAGRYHNFFATL